MKLATFTHRDSRRVGVVVGEEMVDLAVAAPDLPHDMTEFLALGDPALEAARRAVEAAAVRIPLGEVRLDAPVPNPHKYLAIGLNYQDHVDETGREAPNFPIFFNKQTSCVNGPYDPIHLPRASKALDYEGELVFVVGRRCRHVPKDRADEVIAGCLVGNDVSVRDWQRKAQTMTLGKSWDTHGPIGPWIVTTDELGDLHGLGLKTWVNGDLRQDSNTKHLIFGCYDMIETLSTVFTLEPGDLIATGTSGGVGAAMNPRQFLKAGDVVRIQIEGIGYIENPVIDEPLDTARI
jgi:2-keto-4-pentenoate hydratase/2-oxohepta-3-ene-1,7-dioic acid hydratase in catechol pathway